MTQPTPEITITTIRPEDNVTLATIVRSVLTENGLNKPGTVFTDPTTDNLYALYDIPRARYFVARVNGQIAGGAGIHPLDGGPANICELQKMYLLPEYRGLGLAGTLINQCLKYAKEEAGFEQCYLETMPELARARQLYEKFGFRYLDGPLGNTGHFSCDNWMLKDL